MKQFDGRPGEENSHIFAGSDRWMGWIGGLVVASVVMLAIAAAVRS